MALNSATLKARLAALKTNSGTSNYLWKPKPGKKYKIRVVPYKFDRDNPFIELYFHYGIGKRSYLSPVTFGKADPIVEFAEKLKFSGDKDDFNLARKLTPKMRTFVPIIVRGEEDQGVKFWGFGKLVYQRLLTLITEEDLCGDLSDVIKGNDLIVEYIDPKVSGKSFATTEIEVVKNSSPLTTDKEQLKHFIESQVNISDVYTEISYDELKTIFTNYMSGLEESKKLTQPSVSSKDISVDKLVDEATDLQPQQSVETTTLKAVSKKKEPIKEISADEISAEFEKIFESANKK